VLGPKLTFIDANLGSKTRDLFDALQILSSKFLNSPFLFLILCSYVSRAVLA